MCAPPTGAWSPARRWKLAALGPRPGGKALADARKAEAEQLRSPLEPLRYQRQLLENVRLLEAIQEELSASRIELASLMGLPPGMDTQNLRVVEPAFNPVRNGWNSRSRTWKRAR